MFRHTWVYRRTCSCPSSVSGPGCLSAAVQPLYDWSLRLGQVLVFLDNPSSLWYFQEAVTSSKNESFKKQGLRPGSATVTATLKSGSHAHSGQYNGKAQGLTLADFRASHGAAVTLHNRHPEPLVVRFIDCQDQSEGKGSPERLGWMVISHKRLNVNPCLRRATKWPQIVWRPKRKS
jgi:hypothetical protein